MFAFGTEPGVGGLGLQVEFALNALSQVTELKSIGPRSSRNAANARWLRPALRLPDWVAKYTMLRWAPGLRQAIADQIVGQFAREILSAVPVIGFYGFTQVSEESLRYCAKRGLTAVLDSPNGHIRNFRTVLEQESVDLLQTSYLGHPTREVVDRVEREYQLATTIRVASTWAKNSLVSGGVEVDKVHVSDLAVDCDRFRPGPSVPRTGPLRVCFVGSVDLRKGFIYLLRALKPLRKYVELRIVGATGSRDVARLLTREAATLACSLAPGDPLPAYQRADLMVLPSLEDGFGYVGAEAMACGLPIIVTDQCGVAEWISQTETGWVVPARSPEAITSLLELALSKRDSLRAMGAAARAAVVQRMSRHPHQQLAHWFLQVLAAAAA